MLVTKRLRIRPLTQSDAKFALALLNSPGFIEHIGDRKVRTESQVLTYLQSSAMGWGEQVEHGMMCIEYQQQPIGMVGLLKRPHLAYLDIGYAILPEYYGQGFTYEACKAIVNLAATRGEQQLLGAVSKYNVASINLLKKLGMVYLETQDWPDSGDSAEIYHMTLVAE